jgi:Fic family protein
MMEDTIMSLGEFEFDEQGRRLFLPAIPPFPRLEDVHDLLDPAMAALREFDRRLQGWGHQGSIGRLFARLDAVHSSGAEGSTTTFTDLMEYESSLRIAPDTDDADIVSACAEAFDAETEALGNLDAMILRIHRRLFERAKDNMVASSAGKFKTKPNFVHDAEFPDGFFGYTKPSSLPDVLKQWQQFTLTADPKIPELLRQMLSHWMFEHMHPVPDGNGRIGRLLVPIVMKLKNQTGTACTFFGEAVHEDKQLYIDALKDARTTGMTTTFARQMLSFVMITARANLDRLNKLSVLEAEWKQNFTKIRADSVIHRLMPYAITKPVFTINDAQGELNVSYAAANTAAQSLVAAGILSIPEDVRRNRLFHVDAVLNIFDRFRPKPAIAP